MSKQSVPGGEINWYTDKVELQLADISRRGLEAVAAAIDAQAKLNIRENDQIDVGFMINSVYYKSRETSTYQDKSGFHTDKNGNKVKREMAPTAVLPDQYEALVCVGANYAIFQEIEKPFLYPALLAVGNQAGGIIEKVATNA